MINFKQITINVKTEELYKQFNNAINNGHTYLKIEKFPFKEDPFYFKILKDKEENIEIKYATLKEAHYFRTNPFEFNTALSFEKYKEEKTTSKKVKNNIVIKYTANPSFYNDLNDCCNIIKFLTKEEYKIEELEEKLEKLENRISKAESEIRLLDEKKSNKFFV